MTDSGHSAADFRFGCALRAGYWHFRSLDTHLEHFGCFKSQRTLLRAQVAQDRLRGTGSDLRERQ